MENINKKKSKAVYLIGGLLLIAFVVAGYFILLNPGKKATDINEPKQLYTCGMHPDVVQDEPGNCPICGMKLVPMKGTGKKTSGERKILYWRAPMDPNEIYDKPGKSKMGMDLVPVYEDEVSGGSVITIDPVVQQNMNLKTEVVVKKSLSSKIITNGTLAINESRQQIITTRVGGWIEKLYVNYTGQVVKKGQKLVEIYSPDLVAAEQELLTAIAYNSEIEGSSFTDVLKSGNELVKNAIRKLQLLNFPEDDIERLRKDKVIKTNIELYAPFSGTVLNKMVIEGQKINAGTPMIDMADLSDLWLLADIYENEINKIRLGSKADIRFNFLPDKNYTGKVSFIYPTLDAKARTVKIRIDIYNASGILKPNMFAIVELTGIDLGQKPVVSETALIRSGTKDIVIVEIGDGKFKPQEVKIGGYSEGYYQVLEGLTEGMKVVSSAQFLIDSESRLKSALNLFQSSEHQHSNQNAEKNMKESSDSEKSKDEHQHNPEDMKGSNHSDKHSTTEGGSIVRTGIIDLKKIDKNKDGKVFQDLMDWNVIADSPGICPLCEMTLEEVTLKEAKKNLLENGYKVIDN